MVRGDESQFTDILPRYRALVVGISDYSEPGGWNDLRTAAADARAVAEVLERQYGFQVRTLLDDAATRDAMITALDELVDANASDALLIYYAGHGYYDDTLDEGYWIPADARLRASRRPAKSDWIWNSMVTKLAGASPARHVLIVADACYGGSLFRTVDLSESNPDMRWYRRALSAPSRYLITSGSIEPVLDSGTRHSVFAQEFLDFLSHRGGEIFSASELGLALRESVPRLTGQMTRMGPLAVAEHGGGEFVFVRHDSQVGNTSQEALVTEPDSTAQVVYRHAEAGAGPEYARLLKLVRRLREGDWEQGESAVSDIARPRVLACLGPDGDGCRASVDAAAARIRGELENQLRRAGGCVVVERETLAYFLAELEAGASAAVDARASTRIGKLLPASLVLVGELVGAQDGAGSSDLYLRVVDTETSRVLSSWTGMVDEQTDIRALCSSVSEELLSALRNVRPLEAPIRHSSDGAVYAGVGRFHGLSSDARFELVLREEEQPSSVEAPKEDILGYASVAELGEDRSVLDVRWDRSPPSSFAGVWARETADALPY